MFDNDGMDDSARSARAVTAMREYGQACRKVELAQAEAAKKLGEVVEAYAWPQGRGEKDYWDGCSASQNYSKHYRSDLFCELAVAGKISIGATEMLVGDVDILTQQLPLCWAKVISGQAPLWQARRISQTCVMMFDKDLSGLDQEIAPCLGVIGSARLNQVIKAAAARVDPDFARGTKMLSTRCLRSGGYDYDPFTGWVYARVDRCDAIFFDATIQLIADKLATQGSDATKDELRAKALGVLANPAAAVQLLAVVPSSGMDPIVYTDTEKQAFVEASAKLIPAFIPKTQVYVHLYADTLNDPDAVARVEGIGPILYEQISKLTKASKVRLTPVVHTGDNDISVDDYVIPAKIREQVILRNQYDVFPFSSIESRHLDQDHTVEYQIGGKNQTRPGNLGPLSRRAHRAKTHVDGWCLHQPKPGVFIWFTPSGQVVQVDAGGSRVIEFDSS